MKHILIFGKNGQLASAIRDLYNNDKKYKLTFIGKDEFDISSLSSVSNVISKFDDIEYCVNCCAYTNVDGAEDNYRDAYIVNALGVENIASACLMKDIRLIHISTDYVFNGLNNQPYTTYDDPNPLSKYGLSKLNGENMISDIGNSLIIRTSWLYYDNGKNFANTMLNLFEHNSSINVVNDQIGSPTYAADLAKAIFTIIDSEKWIYDTDQNIYHFSGEGAISWYDFANAIKYLTNSKIIINPISTENFLLAKANRPYYSVLDKSAIKRDFGVNVPWWFDSLQKFIQNKHK